MSSEAADGGPVATARAVPGAARRGGRPRSARVDEAILDAAIEEWVEHSLSGMTVERVAARAGVARTTVYRRWSSLPELCMAALDHLSEPLPQPPGNSVREDLLMLLRTLRHILTESRFGRLLPLLVVEAGRYPELSRTYWNDYLVRGSSVIADVLRRGAQEGLIRPDLDLELAVDLLTGPLFKRCLWQLATPDEDLAATVDVVLAGLRP